MFDLNQQLKNENDLYNFTNKKKDYFNKPNLPYQI